MAGLTNNLASTGHQRALKVLSISTCTRALGNLSAWTPRIACVTGTGSFLYSRHLHHPVRPHAVQCRTNATSTNVETVEVQTRTDQEVQAVLFDMDGVLCNSEDISRRAAVEVLQELYGLEVTPEEFIPFMGTGEANFLGGVAKQYGAPFDPEAAKSKFFEIYMDKYATPESDIGYTGARELVTACRKSGLKTALASSADRVKVDANLRAAGLDPTLFDVIMSADGFERLKPAPDIFLAAAEKLGVPARSCVVIEDAAAGVQAARAAGMRCIAVTTSLSEGELVGVAPDVIRNDISAINLTDVQSLKPIGRAPPSQDGNNAQEDFWHSPVQLPGGYRTTRRDLIKFGALGGMVASGYVLLTRAKAMSFASLKGVLNQLLPRDTPTGVG